MSRDALFFAALFATVGIVAAWFLAETTWLLGLSALALGLTTAVFADELSLRKHVYDHSGLPEPESRDGRRRLLQVIGAIFTVAGAAILVAQVV